jgi:undecaprenyl-diphosphatase
MLGPLHSIQNVDVSIYHFLNGFAGNRFLDRLFYYQESHTLLKCGVPVSMYWYFWFRDGPDQERRRTAIFTIIVGAILALAINRAISTLTPFRVRPMFDLALQHRPLSIQPLTDLVDWSAFPSDHAAYLCALAFGLAYLSRRLRLPMILFAAGWICLPRLYLGVHYASDIVVGAGIGVATVWALLRADWLRSLFALRLRAFNAKPQWFYMVAFLVMFEMGDLFLDLREPVHILLHNISRAGRYHQIIRYGLLFLASLGAGIAVFVARLRPSLAPRYSAYGNSTPENNSAEAVSTPDSRS